MSKLSYCIFGVYKLILEAVLEYTNSSISVPQFLITIPSNSSYGDLSTGVAFSLTNLIKRSPYEIATDIANKLMDRTSNIVEKIDVVKPGYINFFMKNSFWHDVMHDVLNAGADYGKGDLGKGEKVLIEYVSANPTGPIHVGHGRGAVVGDVLARVLASQGYNVTREYYINDAGNQVLSLGYSVLNEYSREYNSMLKVSKTGEYQGDYIKEIANSLNTGMEPGNINEENIQLITDFSVNFILNGIKTVLKNFNIEFDSWFSEKSLYASGSVEKVIEELKKKNAIKYEDGATWFLSTLYGDEKDRVLKKQSGELTYFASDVAYHINKYERGFNKLINIWGADHHGYLPRIRAALNALGYDTDRLIVMFVQMVRLTRGDKPVAMSKRAGEYITLKELIDEVGNDAVRFFFLQRSHESQLIFDIELAKKQSQENPVYYVQYAHARIANIFNYAITKGWNVASLKQNRDYEFTEAEKQLLSLCLLYPQLVREIAVKREPHRLTHYLMELVGILHKYYTDTRVVDNDSNTEQRLLLMKVVKIVLKNALDLLGINAPEKM
ncbi:MAG: arginine--tRNA ligase [bacterium]